MPNLLSEMRSFALVVDHGGFSAAARETGVSKARLSQHVKRLEEAVGAQLLFRSTRRMSVTRAGAVMLDHGRRVLSAQDEAFDAIEALSGEPMGQVGVTVPVSFGEMFLGDVIRGFRVAYPRIRVLLELDNRYQDLKATASDLAIRAGLPDDPDQVAIPLGEYAELTCAAPGYLADNPVPLAQPSDLARHDCLVNHHSCRDGRWTFFSDGRAESVAISGPVSLNHFPLVRDAAVSGMGVARLPRYLAAPEIAAGRLIEVLGDHASPVSPIYLVYIRETRLPRRVRVLVDFVRDWFRGRPELLRQGYLG
jgi:DNA-binding transcriptional LysR family regulator